MSGDLTHVKGLSALNALLQTLPVKLEKNVLRGSLRAGAKPVQQEIQRNIWKDTGEMQRGVKIGTTSKGGRVTAKIRVTGKHAFAAAWLENGVGAHAITAKASKELFFGGVFAKSVMHPGIQPRPVFRPALDSQAGQAVVSAAEYMKNRLATKEGLDTSDIEIEEVAVE